MPPYGLWRGKEKLNRVRVQQAIIEGRLTKALLSPELNPMASGSKICENVLEVVGSAISYEISRLTQSKLMKKPMKSYTPELINNFSIDSLVEEMKRIAPITLDILRRAGGGT
ncbi:hypothetical protein BDZ91DRAFT_799077 [Kalaharituber pfeilii]|nr:hypothetical protein BDZ91DRAFT_799077 [Kalaharituber pfeilii]